MTDTAATDRYSNLGALDRGLVEIGLRPRWPVYVFTAIAVFVGWFWLSFLVAGVSAFSDTAILGPGMSVVASWFDWIRVGQIENQLILAILEICLPRNPEQFSLSLYTSTFLMWLMMSLAMMLPSAAPMMRTYGDIADVAAQKGERVAPLAILVAGYLCVWAAFSAVVSILQLGLVWLGITSDTVLPVRGTAAGLILVLAGAYQFSSLRDACLTKCRNPFSILFARWSSEYSGIFKLGVEQGLFCLGCCWALMMVMLVVGTMNLAWMAFFTLFAVIEKSGKGRVTSHFSGGILLLWGGILILSSLMSLSI